MNVRVGKSKRVHVTTPPRSWQRPTWVTTYCGYHGSTNSWMVVTADEPTCKTCLRKMPGLRKVPHD